MTLSLAAPGGPPSLVLIGEATASLPFKRSHRAPSLSPDLRGLTEPTGGSSMKQIITAAALICVALLAFGACGGDDGTTTTPIPPPVTVSPDGVPVPDFVQPTTNTPEAAPTVLADSDGCKDVTYETRDLPAVLLTLDEGQVIARAFGHTFESVGDDNRRRLRSKPSHSFDWCFVDYLLPPSFTPREWTYPVDEDGNRENGMTVSVDGTWPVSRVYYGNASEGLCDKYNHNLLHGRRDSDVHLVRTHLEHCSTE